MRDDIDRHVTRISRKFGGSVRQLQELLAELDVETLSRQEERRIIRQVNAILDDLDVEMHDEAEHSYNDIYERGRADVLVALGVFATVGAARRYLRSDDAVTSRAHRATMREYETLTDDLLAATQNTRRRVKQSVRKAASRRLSDGIRQREGVYSISRDLKRDLRREFREAANFAIRDRLNRRWKLDHYVDVVVRTKLAEAHRESTRIEATERGAYYVRVSQHATACEKCIPWEGRILKLTADAPGDYSTLDEAMAAGFFHPQCRHAITPVREP